MTEIEIEKRKTRIRYELQDQRLIMEIYPSIEKVKIEYTINYISVFGKSEVSNSLILTPNHPNIFEIDCINRECTQGYFNLTPIVRKMVHLQLTEYKSFINCEGSEVHDHPYQSCGSILQYTITITYRH